MSNPDLSTNMPDTHARHARIAQRFPVSVIIITCSVMLTALVIMGIFFLSNSSVSTPSKASDTVENADDTTEEAAYESPYAWEGLGVDENGRLTYSENGQIVSRVGIDVSHYQGVIDWEAVAADGIDFVFVRVGYRGYTSGGLLADTYYAENLDGATAAGLDVGAYFFSQAITVEEALEEAEFVLSLLAGRDLTYPVAFDHEPVSDSSGRANNLDSETLTTCAEAFCARIEEAGYSAILYGNAADMARYQVSVTENRAVWFAEYNVSTPSAQFDFAIWQYSNAGTVAGISTFVDLNIAFLTAPIPLT